MHHQWSLWKVRFPFKKWGYFIYEPIFKNQASVKEVVQSIKHHLISLLITWSYCGTVKSRSFMPPHTVDHVYSASKDKISRREKIIWYYWIHIGVWEVEACTARLLCSKKRICRRKTIFIVYWNCSWFVHFGVLPRVFPKHDSLFPRPPFCDIIQMREMNSRKNFTNQVWNLIIKSQVKFCGECYHR